MTLVLNSQLGEYYGVQGTTWNQPAAAAQPQRHARRQRESSAAVRQRRPPHAGGLAQGPDVYWISNTLTSTIPNPQMVGMAASLTLAVAH